MNIEMTIKITDYGDASQDGIAMQLHYWNVQFLRIKNLPFDSAVGPTLEIFGFGDVTEAQIVRQLRYWRVKGIIRYYDNTEVIL